MVHRQPQRLPANQFACHWDVLTGQMTSFLYEGAQVKRSGMLPSGLGRRGRPDREAILLLPLPQRPLLRECAWAAPFGQPAGDGVRSGPGPLAPSEPMPGQRRRRASSGGAEAGGGGRALGRFARPRPVAGRDGQAPSCRSGRPGASGHGSGGLADPPRSPGVAHVLCNLSCRLVVLSRSRGRVRAPGPSKDDARRATENRSGDGVGSDYWGPISRAA